MFKTPPKPQRVRLFKKNNKKLTDSHVHCSPYCSYCICFLLSHIQVYINATEIQLVEKEQS